MIKLKQLAVVLTIFLVVAGFRLYDLKDETYLDIGLEILYLKLDRDLTSELRGQYQCHNVKTICSIFAAKLVW